MAEDRKSEEKEGLWMQRVGIWLSVGAIVALSLIASWAAAFFFLPLAVLALGTWIFVMAVRKMPVRNHLADDGPRLSERYADGQPLGRALTQERTAQDRTMQASLRKAAPTKHEDRPPQEL